MAEPTVTAALVTAVSVLGVGVIGAVSYYARRNGKQNGLLREFMQGREERIDRMLSALENNNLILAGLARDLSESVHDQRASHNEQTKALTTILERLRDGKR